jgi:hypothetical protein
MCPPTFFLYQILVALKPYHEAWAGVPLKGAMAYGLRVYRNDSNLHMHVDKSNTHIISCILHVDHDQDPESEPWPIVIEDFQGNTNEVFLESGDLLFYESSKCLHGRPKRFKGKWYSSLFVHYYPAVNWEVSFYYVALRDSAFLTDVFLFLSKKTIFLATFSFKNVKMKVITVFLGIGMKKLLMKEKWM